MKKWKVSLVFILLILLLGTNVMAKDSFIDVKINNSWVSVNKVPMLLDENLLETKPSSYIDGSRTMVPIRFFAEQLGAKVDWNQEFQEVTVSKDGHVLNLFINSQQILKDGKEEYLDDDSTPRVTYFDHSENGSTMVPLSFISTALGFEVYYDWDQGYPVINTKGEKLPEPEDLRNPITNIDIIRTSTGRAKLVIEADKKLDYKFDVDYDKNIMILEFFDSKLAHINTAGDYVNKNIDDINLRRIEYFQNGDNVKIVVAANDISTYGFKSLNNGTKEILSFNEDLQGVKLDKNKVIIPNAGNLRYKTFTLTNPNRIVIDIFDGELKNGGYFEIGGENTFVKQIRIANFTTDKTYKLEDNVVRLVLDVKDGNEDRNFKAITSGKDMVLELDNMNEPKPEKPNPLPPENKPGNKTIFIDAGHGGRDPGAVSKNGTREKDLTLSLSLKAEQVLKAAGYNVVMTRKTDTYVDYRNVGQLANNSNADLFVSFHINSAGSITSANGIETLYCPATNSNIKEDNQYPFADTIQKELIKETGATNRGVKKRPELAVLNSTKMPAVMIEAGFLTNPKEEQLLKTDAYQNKIVKAVVNAINKYLK